MPSRHVVAGFFFGLLLLPVIGVRAAPATETLECTSEQVNAPAVAITDDEAAQHRRFQVPVIDYPFDTKLDGEWGQPLTVRVGPDGHVVCYVLEHDYVNHPLRPPVARVLAHVGQWRYLPFVRDGKPVIATVRERIDEQESPSREIAMPTAPLHDMTVTLRRSACFGTCPVYTVRISGDGHVTYTGDAFVKTKGKHEYTIQTPAVAQLFDDIRAKNLWSLREHYAAGVTDMPTVTIEIRVGLSTHKIVDYMGRWVGMPRAVNDIQAQIDRIADTARWIGKPQSY